MTDPISFDLKPGNAVRAQPGVRLVLRPDGDVWAVPDSPEPVDQGKLLRACRQLVQLNAVPEPERLVWHTLCERAVDDIRAALGVKP